MRASTNLVLVLATAACAHAGPPTSTVPSPPPSSRSAWDLEISPLVTGIWVIRRPDVLRQPVEPNVTVIVNERDVVVVDGGGTPLAAENALRLIRTVTDKPVSMLVNTHWHGDHHMGNQVYRAAFPGLSIVSHANTRRDVTGAPMRYLERLPAAYRGALDDFKKREATGELTERQRVLAADLELGLREAERTVVTPADLTIEDGLVIHRGAREIQVRWLGRGNTEGDLVVWLPGEKVLAAGDLVVEPIPYGFGSFPAEWMAALERIAALDFAFLVPGHGAIQRDRTYVRRLQALLGEVRAQVGAAAAKGLDLDATRRAVDLSGFRKEFVGEDAHLQQLFDAWWTSPIVRSAWLEAKGLPIVQGASDETG
jgi:glyoxylase-like metal-dependent hydrolase (beta-lactamase superfamily II)